METISTTPSHTPRTPSVASPAVQGECITTCSHIMAALNPRVSPAVIQKVAAYLAEHMPSSGNSFGREIELLHQCMTMLSAPDSVREGLDEQTQLEVVDYAQELMRQEKPIHSLHGNTTLGKFSECIWRARIGLAPVPIM